MGNEVSSDAEGGGEEMKAEQTGEESGLGAGYRVMKVFRGSAAARCGLRAYEDFILGVLGEAVTDDNAALGRILNAHEGNDVQLDVYNVIDGSARLVTLRPAKWNGPGLLGAAVRYENVNGACDAVWHVVDVIQDSPAHAAGLVPKSDYIVGSPAQAFRAQGEFNKLIADCIDKGTAASVMVYSTATGRVRNVELRPQEDWGGEGVLGCELATGLLHRIHRDPPPAPEPASVLDSGTAQPGQPETVVQEAR